MRNVTGWGWHHCLTLTCLPPEQSGLPGSKSCAALTPSEGGGEDCPHWHPHARWLRGHLGCEGGVGCALTTAAKILELKNSTELHREDAQEVQVPPRLCSHTSALEFK